ncbi:tRNA 2-thiouridine(34) synthase MnmA [Pseudonocardia sp. KRD291]|uniref:tRNA 2-thiouridine(34) synthase MnmA n=1 Tax=Pseudonocardia sp. KRD291 TaxID=2792007 RepID=UPI001C4A2C15|nr:tRNA 2-thiouridine(34) synthase MnmA [Pseudonocardia sp. KRD291]MBW0105667.1 tRNA 2-thiouridine(34) synthase MnmA [Pseudonocardia sp. KRD291]
MRVLAAMSGGVDSAVAAARAVAAGHEVVGVHLALARTRDALRSGSRGCCSREDAADAARAADMLEIPYYVWDLSEQFARDVVDDFVSAYAAGETPNPCLRCNEKIKFAAVLDRALALGFDAVCTGHYARLTPDAPDGPVLRRSADPDKDQSYVLAVLRSDQLRHAMFPIGDTAKPQIRSEAAALGLRVAGKPDSHDICFIPTGDTQGFLAERLGERPGEIVDESGEVLGTHAGVHGFTVGQRKGLGIDRPASDGRPRYVLGIEPVSGTVRVGSDAALDVSTIEARTPVWSSGTAPDGPFSAVAQVRAHGGVAPCEVVPAEDGGLRVALSEPLRGVAPGQAVAFYRPDPGGDVVLGSATIAATA